MRKVRPHRVSSSQSRPQRVICRLPSTTLVLSRFTESTTPVRPGAARRSRSTSPSGSGTASPFTTRQHRTPEAAKRRKRWRTSPEWAASS